MTYLLNELDPLEIDTRGLELGELARAEKVLEDADKFLGVAKTLRPEDLASGNEGMNTKFLAEVFAKNHGFEPEESLGKQSVEDFARVLNERLKEDSELKDVLPISTEDESLFRKCKDGIVLK